MCTACAWHVYTQVRDQLIGKLATDYRALFSAVTEIISGLAINAGTMMKRATGNVVYAVHGRSVCMACSNMHPMHVHAYTCASS